MPVIASMGRNNVAFLLGVIVGLLAALPLLAVRQTNNVGIGLAAVFVSFALYHVGIFLVWRLAPVELVPCASVSVFVFLGCVVAASLLSSRRL